ncbi:MULTISPECIES: FAD-binding oxidoreductase [unclassified Acinetobacter]|uniref:NAD(P)/FAD-dependent oxidoreductase n=1 Tax=unclassified Acinetobacter TaxID=196816 RepID=UPI002934B811|nr:MULTISPECIES: FAD-binding oxidoreductase [unclassified Acinetobacter]WOE32419.1 FAD-binding oxidoreductase [Acinetobacter sp. SAAs470]WOE37893.1 FAD-binding oxidoreductase [Acinetobacter sp. SAAs474]
MVPTIVPVKTSSQLPATATVVIIGGGIVGLNAALTLAERNISVVVIEKGQIAAEQSSRNLGWVRKTNRLADDVPLALASDQLWSEMNERVAGEVGYRQAGIMFLSSQPEQIELQQKWLKSVAHLNLDSKIISAQDVNELVPHGQANWAGALYTPSDGRAEPTLASSAIATAAIKHGAIIVEQCAARQLDIQNGRVVGVYTEKGKISCDQILLAGGFWSRRFLGNLGISLPSLPLVCSVFKTKPMQGPTEIAVGASNFSFRKHIDGGYIITQRGKLDAPLTLDHLLLGSKYWQQLKTQRDFLNISFGRYFFQDLSAPRKWSKDTVTQFEKVRMMDPVANQTLNQEAWQNLAAAWPIFKHAEIENSWAGMIDVTPDSNPIIDSIEHIQGLTIATGFSGHGFGTSPAAGHLAADLISQHQPIIDPTPYSFKRL